MRFTKLLCLILVLLYLPACFGPLRSSPKNIEGLAHEYVVLQGKLASAPKFKQGDEVMEIYFGIGEKKEKFPTKVTDAETGKEVPVPVEQLGAQERFEAVKYCVAFNKEEKNRLKDAAELMTQSMAADRPIFLYAKMIEGRKFKWWYDGLDCVVYAVGAYKPEVYKYVTLDTAYGLSWQDSFSFKTFIRDALKSTGKAAVKAIP